MKEDLNVLRGKIDEIDASLARLFAERQELSEKIARAKSEARLPLADCAREEEVLARVREYAGKNCPEIENLYREIFSLSKARQCAGRPVTGLIGKSLSHSASPLLHALLGDENYRLFEIPEDSLQSFLHSDAWDAVNVTVPYKKTALASCDALSGIAARCGAVNVLTKKDGKILGDNTDYAGFLALADGIPVRGKKIALIGDGGAAAAVKCALNDLGAGEIVTVTRSGAVTPKDTGRYADADILINATPVGMTPDTDAVPVDLGIFPRLSAVLDLIASPIRTRLVQEAEARGIPARGGLKMLCVQAHGAWRLFHSSPPALTEEELYACALSKLQNLVLIGLPGCGKTTMGRALAGILGKEFFDTDLLLEEKASKPIPRIFAEDGEAAFRKAEAEVIASLAAKSGCVIATGGGAPLSEENRKNLKQNGLIIHLDCPVEELSHEGRPLSPDAGSAARLAAERSEVYAACRDIRFSYTKQEPNPTERLIALIDTQRSNA